MLYSIGASYNPRMSRPDRSVQRGLAGIKGLSFAYRLNTWGTKNTPPMVNANTFRKGFIPPQPTGLASPFTWLEGVFGVESPQDMLVDAMNNLNSILAPLDNVQTSIQTLIDQAQGYDSSTDTTVRAKAQASESEAAGLLSSYSTIQYTAQGLMNSIHALQGNSAVTKDNAQMLKDQVAALQSPVKDLVKGVSQLASDVSALAKYAQSGPGVVAGIESAAVNSISTLTWIAGIGGLAYLLLPSFLPRITRGFGKAVRG